MRGSLVPEKGKRPRERGRLDVLTSAAGLEEVVRARRDGSLAEGRDVDGRGEAARAEAGGGDGAIRRDQRLEQVDARVRQVAVDVGEGLTVSVVPFVPRVKTLVPIW